MNPHPKGCTTNHPQGVYNKQSYVQAGLRFIWVAPLGLLGLLEPRGLLALRGLEQVRPGAQAACT